MFSHGIFHPSISYHPTPSAVHRRALPPGSGPVPPIQAVDHRRRLARHRAPLRAVRALRGARGARGARGGGRGAARRVRGRGVAGRAGGVRGLRASRAGARAARAGAHARARVAAALPGDPRQVQEQQVSPLYYSACIVRDPFF